MEKQFKTPLLFLIIIAYSFTLSAQVQDFSEADFSKADSIAALYPQHSLQDLPLLADKLTRTLPTEVEKFRSIYSWICTNIDNDYGLYVENKRVREKLKDIKALDAWNRKFGKRVFHTLMTDRKTVCSGYAYLVKELALHAGLNCEVIDGYGRTAHANVRGQATANHTWNAIQLDGHWFLCDATWSSGSIDATLKRFIKKYDDSYFLADPSLFVRSHYPLDSSWLLLGEKPTIQAFLNGPLIYRGAFRYNINPQFPETFDVAGKKGEPISFRFAKQGNDKFENVTLQFIRAGQSNVVVPTVSHSDDGVYNIDHVFASKGTHIVHLLLNDEYIVSYSVKIE
ncbi:transglutaminase domain-containing protein [Chryseolinea sp. H1M3-3]|uniref:transglutaminase domain-containing protein n=1 Tax=Chryseolinea sp. H1M3-3 TaxID=3034144 RepID=UPI0023EB6751|nr:transglutaminase domain-containing protein [Chryseolinea sp. H1M3-3]